MFRWMPALTLVVTVLATPLADAVPSDCPVVESIGVEGFEVNMRKAGGQQGEYVQSCAGLEVQAPLPVCGRGVAVKGLGPVSGEILAGESCRTLIVLEY